MVEEEPVEAELADGFEEFGEVDGFADVAVAAEGVAGEEVLFLAGGGEDDDGEELGAVVLADAAEDFEAVDFGEFEVEEDDGGADGAALAIGPEEEVEGFGAVAGDGDGVGDVVFPEGEKGKFFVVGVVFDEEDGFAAHGGVWGLGMGRGQRENRKAAPLPGSAWAVMRPP